MADVDEKVYTPAVIDENPLPGEDRSASLQETGSSGSAKNETYSASKIEEQSLPQKVVAVDVIGNVLNTKTKKILGEFKFTPSGAIQIGDYQDGESGDIRISRNGISARDKYGNETIAIDGDSGDAVFAGRLQTGALVAGVVAVGDNSIVIDGVTKRMLWYDADGIPNIVIGVIS